MIAELTTEEIVTQLLSTEEILKPQKEQIYSSPSTSLGNFLKNLPADKPKKISINTNKNKYTFIKDNYWRF